MAASTAYSTSSTSTAAAAGGNASTLLDPFLHRLPAIYSHAPIVHQHVTHLLSSSPHGSNLLPTMESLINNDGSSTPPVLLLRGTIPMQYKGIMYHLPIDLYLPPSYPKIGPTVYVRPVASMCIKPNHKHVGLDGMVYLPYLAEWNASTTISTTIATAASSSTRGSNLIELVIWMSRLFGEEPPCFAKPITTTTTSSGSGGDSGLSSGGGSDTVRHAAEAREHERRRLELERNARWEEQLLLQEAKLSSLRSRATEEIQSNMKSIFAEVGEEIRNELQYQKKLEYGSEQIALIRKEYEMRRGKLEEGTRELDSAINTLECWLTAVENVSKLQEAQQQTEQQYASSAASASAPPDHNASTDSSMTSSTTTLTARADLMALPIDTPSAQMLSLSAESASIDDTIYFLDQALVRNTISLDIFMKEVRRLSKRQFMAKVCICADMPMVVSNFRSPATHPHYLPLLPLYRHI